MLYKSRSLKSGRSQLHWHLEVRPEEGALFCVVQKLHLRGVLRTGVVLIHSLELYLIGRGHVRIPLGI